MWQAIAAAAAAVIGSITQSNSAKSASKRAKKGTDKQLDFAREAMLLARADTQPYRQAGSTALNALMALTGLSGNAKTTAVNPDTGYPREQIDQAEYIPDAPRVSARMPWGRGSGYNLRFNGGAVNPEAYYNINEFGPEDVYEGGSYTRTPTPRTINPNSDGYVHPNIEGRGLGGFLKRATGLWARTSPLTGHGLLVSGGGKNRKRESPPEAPPAPTTDINTNLGMDFEFTTDPGYQFRFEEGQRALDRGAAARGGLLSGGYARKAIRYGQGFASNEYTNVYNRIANIAQLGQVANQFAGNAALYGGAQMGSAAAAGGINSAYGAIGQGNAQVNALNQLGQIDWDAIFNRN